MTYAACSYLWVVYLRQVRFEDEEAWLLVGVKRLRVAQAG